MIAFGKRLYFTFFYIHVVLFLEKITGLTHVVIQILEQRSHLITRKFGRLYCERSHDRAVAFNHLYLTYETFPLFVMKNGFVTATG